MFKSLLLLIGALLILFVLPFNTFEEIQLIDDKINVYVKGEVRKGGYLELSAHSKVSELLEQVELTERADVGALDLNKYLSHEEVITIPSKEEFVCVSLNSATAEQLMTLPGVGPSTAQKIIDYRESHGFFVSFEDLLDVKGIGPSKYEKLKEFICL
ncbi:MAG: ComEA family DNA-binding protein [Erysipelothrix sp.]|nr:ComEA family DNA-binding protein [Erysipelothrix sp.]